MLNLDLKGKRALVTGAAHGIGEGCARALAQAGAEVILHDLPSETEKLKQLAHELDGQHRLLGNYFDDQTRVRLMQEATQDGSIDIFISNPYKSIRASTVNLDLPQFREVVDATLTSHFHMAQLVIRHMVNHDIQGSLIFIGSIYGIINRTNSIAYDTAKAGLHHMTKVLARECFEGRIRVNTIAPGYTDTIGERRFAKEEEIQQTADRLPFGELCLPSDIGHAATFLASDLARMITGHVMVVDGGMSMCDFSYT